MSVLGVVVLNKTRRNAEIPFAMVPLLFGVQQLIEGILWLTFQFDVPLIRMTMTYVFTLFSHVLWPVFIPLSIMLVEPVAWRKKTLGVFLFTGIAVGLYLLYFIVKYPVTAQVNCNIVYVLPHFNKLPVMALYLAATCVGSFFSSHRMIVLFGVLALLLFMVAYWFYTVAFYSVWCYFAALLSGVIYLHFRSEQGPIKQRVE